MTDHRSPVNRFEVFAPDPHLRHSQAMKRVLPLVFLAVVGACAPLQLYYKPGVSLDRLQSDQTACEVKALRDAPVATQTRVSPPYYVSARKYCDAAGQCHVRGGYWIPGDVYTVDVNEKLRQKVELSCMQSRGYSPASIPLCPPNVAQAAEPGKTTILPTLSETSCAIRNNDGSFQIVRQAE